MTTMKRRSAKRGAMAQQNFESVKSFCKLVALAIQAEGINSEYFSDVYIGYLADSSGLKKADGENLAAFDLRADKMAADKFNAMKESEEGRAKLEESAVFATMANKEAMYKVFRESLPCYTEGGKFSFAKPKCIAYRVTDLSDEDIKELESKNTFQRIAVFVEGKDVEYICRNLYASNIENDLIETYRSRRAFLAEEKEQTKAYFKANGRFIYTLESANKGTFKTFAPALSVSLQDEAAAIRRRRAADAEAARKAEKAAAEAAAFIEKEGREKLADLAAVIVKIAAAVESDEYNAKAKASVTNKIEGIIKAIRTKGEAVRAYYQEAAEAAAAKKEAAEADAKAAAPDSAAAEELKKAAALHAEAEAAADAKDKEARQIMAAAELFGLKLKAEATAAELRKAAAPYLSGEAAEANEKAIKAAKAAAPESGEEKAKAKGRRAKKEAAAPESVTAETKAEESAAA